MPALKKAIRNYVLPVVTGLGMEKLLRIPARGNQLILTYHGVTSSPYPFSLGRHLNVKEFERHLQYLKKKFTVLPLKELSAVQPKTKKPAVAITFDDGYENNLTLALPLLEKYELPATFFITSALLTEPAFVLWPYYIYVLLQYAPEKEFTFDGHVFVRKPGLRDVYSETLQTTLIEYIKKMGAGRNEQLELLAKRYAFDKLSEQTGTEYFRMMTPAQLSVMAASPLVEIGSHTHFHYCLANIDPQLAFEELKQSRTLLENAIGKPVESIAFPDGSYTETVKDEARKAGYSRMLAVDFRCADDVNQPDILPRYCISNTTTYDTNVLLMNKAFRTVGF